MLSTLCSLSSTGCVNRVCLIVARSADWWQGCREATGSPSLHILCP